MLATKDNTTVGTKLIINRNYLETNTPPKLNGNAYLDSKNSNIEYLIVESIISPAVVTVQPYDKNNNKIDMVHGLSIAGPQWDCELYEYQIPIIDKIIDDLTILENKFNENHTKN